MRVGTMAGIKSSSTIQGWPAVSQDSTVNHVAAI
jgi:hypothetical protein